MIISRRDTTGHVTLNGERVLMMGANDYLGLSTHPAVLSAVTEALQTYGTGLTVYPVFVTSEIHNTLEAELAEFLGVEEVMLTSSGGTANSCVLTTLAGAGDLIVSEGHNHASIIDAARASKARVVPYKTRDTTHLSDLLNSETGNGRTIVITDGVFSMDGGVAPLPEIKALCDRHDAILVVDEAHATAVIGPGGTGSAPSHSMSNGADNYLVTGSLSKALGGAGGGFVGGPSALINEMRGKSRSHIFTQGMTTANTAATLAALRTLRSEPELLQKLWNNVATVKDMADQLGLPLLASDSAILAVNTADEALTQAVVEGLRKEGVFVQAMTYPIVARNEARIRLQPSASHSHDALKAVMRTISRVIEAYQ